MNRDLKYFQIYLSSIKNLSNNTISAYSSDLNKLEEYLISINKTFYTANNKDVNDFLTDLDLKTKSYNRKITAISEFYKYLSNEKISYCIDMNKLVHIKNDKIYPRIINLEDIRKMIAIQENNIIGQRNKVIILLLYISGLRVSELINLTYNDINIKEGYIRVIGKGNKEKVIVVGDLLSVTLTNYSNDIRSQILRGLDSNYVFVNTEGEPLSRQAIYDIVSLSAKKAGIKLNVTPHTLRHCFATHMIENGADIRSVQELLGHSNISTTQIYLNIAKTKLKENYLSKFDDPLKEEEKNEI